MPADLIRGRVPVGVKKTVKTGDWSLGSRPGLSAALY